MDAIRRELLEKYEGTWMLPDDIDALIEVIEAAMGPLQVESVTEIEALRLANAKVRQENARLRRLLDATGMDWSTLEESVTKKYCPWCAKRFAGEGYPDFMIDPLLDGPAVAILQDAGVVGEIRACSESCWKSFMEATVTGNNHDNS